MWQPFFMLIKTMTAVIIISAVTVILMIASVLIKPNIEIKGKSISIYWMIVLVGALVLMISGLVPFGEAFRGMTADTSINPIKILVLFLSMSMMSIFLDEVGLFRFLASYTLGKAKSSQKMMFIYLYVVVSVLTVFTSNDIIILTFTPFICYFAKNAKIDPVPYLFAEFVAANTWSMMFIIGNPTNVYLATTNGISFARYFLVMCIPTIMGGVAAFLVLFLLFRKKLEKPIEAKVENVRIENKVLLIMGVTHLAVCTILLVLSSYIGTEMWLVTLIFAMSLFLLVLVYQFFSKIRNGELNRSFLRIPWELIPFVLSMFVIVLALDKYGVTDALADLLENGPAVWVYGAASFLSANLVNNIPMSVLFCSVIGNAPSASMIPATYAAVIGSNLGAILTPIGALAGIMWSAILKKHEVKFSFLDFVKYGVIISIPTLFFTLLGLTFTAPR